MSVVAPPRPPDVQASPDPDALEALIEEARRRARRRRQAYGLAAMLLAALGVGAFFGFRGNSGHADTTGARPPRLPVPVSRPAHPLPANAALTIVAGDARGDAIETVLGSGQTRTLIACGDGPPARTCAAHSFAVDWAPNGRQIAYTTAIGPGGADWDLVALYVEDTATGSVRRRELSCFGQDVDWSPDGSRIAFDCGGSIYLIRSDLSRGTKLRTGTPGVNVAPSWSPDGRYIAFENRQPGRLDSVYLVAPGSTRLGSRLIARNASAPAWSPDGRRIAYRASCGGIKLVTPAGNDVTPASVVLKCRVIGVRGVPVWSPDGRKIAVSKGSLPMRCRYRSFSADPADPCIPSGIWVMTARGRGLHLLTDENGRNFAGRGRPTWRPRPRSGR